MEERQTELSGGARLLAGGIWSLSIIPRRDRIQRRWQPQNPTRVTRAFYTRLCPFLAELFASDDYVSAMGTSKENGKKFRIASRAGRVRLPFPTNQNPPSSMFRLLSSGPSCLSGVCCLHVSLSFAYPRTISTAVHSHHIRTQVCYYVVNA